MNTTKGGGGTDERPYFSLAVAGHPDFLAAGPWAWKPPSRRPETPAVAAVWAVIGRAISKKVGSHRVAILTRGDDSGIDLAARAYAAGHALPHPPLAAQRDVWGEGAVFRRDLELVGRAHALLWFGDHVSDGDPLALCRMLGFPVRVVVPADLPVVS